MKPIPSLNLSLSALFNRVRRAVLKRIVERIAVHSHTVSEQSRGDESSSMRVRWWGSAYTRGGGASETTAAVAAAMSFAAQSKESVATSSLT